MNQTTCSYPADFVGTFTLVFMGTSMAILQGFHKGDWAPGSGLFAVSFAFGFMLIVLVLTVGPVSGCHLNPALSISMACPGG